MATPATITTTTTLTPPRSSHGEESSWNFPGANTETTAHEKYGAAHSNYAPNNNNNQAQARTGNSFNPSHQSGPELATRKMQSAENLSAARWEKSTHPNALSPQLPIESNMGRSSPAEWPMQNQHRADPPQPAKAAYKGQDYDNSQWIHRDKLAKIESRELQAAGIVVPRSRAPSKRRDRSQSRLRRGTDSSDQNQTQTRSRKNSAAADQRPKDVTSPNWDLRTPEEIAEEETNAYFASNGLRSGSRIPVAKTSPAPIPLEHLERSSTTSRTVPDSPKGESTLYMAKGRRSRSSSAGGGFGFDPPNPSGMMSAAKRSASDMSPKKNTAGARKPSTPAKSTTPARPGTRSGSVGGTRPSTRSGDFTNHKQPEGEPPWMINAYKPDPRLPPDQQLLPTVARRLQQEQWEKEGKFGDVYDKDFRPLNDNVLRPPEWESGPAKEEYKQPPPLGPDEWPLKLEAAARKSPPLRQGSYSTMPKIADKPQASPLASPRTPAPSEHPNQQPPRMSSISQTPQRLPEQEEEPAKKGGCGCCVVM